MMRHEPLGGPGTRAEPVPASDTLRPDIALPGASWRLLCTTYGLDLQHERQNLGLSYGRDRLRTVAGLICDLRRHLRLPPDTARSAGVEAEWTAAVAELERAAARVGKLAAKGLGQLNSIEVRGGPRPLSRQGPRPILKLALTAAGMLADEGQMSRKRLLELVSAVHRHVTGDDHDRGVERACREAMAILRAAETGAKTGG